MFNPEEYFEQVEKVLGTCRNATVCTNDLMVYPDWTTWKTITWRLNMRWDSGHQLDVSDLYAKQWPFKKIFRSFRYHFMDGNKQCIFRMDTHGNRVPIEEPCHIHIGSGEEVYEDDDARLRGFRLTDINFLNALSMAHQHLKGKKMGWES